MGRFRVNVDSSNSLVKSVLMFQSHVDEAKGSFVNSWSLVSLLHSFTCRFSSLCCCQSLVFLQFSVILFCFVLSSVSCFCQLCLSSLESHSMQSCVFASYCQSSLGHQSNMFLSKKSKCFVCFVCFIVVLSLSDV